MSPYEERDGDEEVVPNTARDNQCSTSMECFSEDSSSASNPVAAGFTAAATSSGGRGALPPRGPGGSERLDLNSLPPTSTTGRHLVSAVGDAEAALVRGGAAATRTRSLGAPAGTAARLYRALRPAGASTRKVTTAPGSGRRGVRGGAGVVAGGEDEEGDGDHAPLRQASSEELVFDKADWNSNNNAVFCELCVHEIRAGNAPNGFMSARGYKNISDNFYARVGLRHSEIQLKDRWDALKGLYIFWLWLNKQTGLGQANGTVVASESFWEEHTRGCAEWRKLKDGPPECLGDLEVMFQHISVDGSSCVPAELIGDEGGRGNVVCDNDNGCDGRPLSITSLKRGGSTSTCATSARKRARTTSARNKARKRVKNAMVKIMKGILETMQANSIVARKVMLGELRAESIRRVMRLVVESGAAEGSIEHFVATRCKG